MSRVTNVILCMGLLDEDNGEVEQKLQEVNVFFRDDQRGFVYVGDSHLPDGWYGGSKVFTVTLALGAFKWLNLDALIKHIQSIEWEDPEMVQLIVKEEDDEKFRIIDMFDTKGEGR